MLLSSVENDAGNELYEFGAEGAEGCFGARLAVGVGRACRFDGEPDASPSCQTGADENTARLQVFSAPIGLDDLFAEVFVGFDGPLWNG